MVAYNYLSQRTHQTNTVVSWPQMKASGAYPWLEAWEAFEDNLEVVQGNLEVFVDKKAFEDNLEAVQGDSGVFGDNVEDFEIQIVNQKRSFDRLGDLFFYYFVV